MARYRRYARHNGVADDCVSFVEDLQAEMEMLRATKVFSDKQILTLMGIKKAAFLQRARPVLASKRERKAAAKLEAAAERALQEAATETARGTGRSTGRSGRTQRTAPGEQSIEAVDPEKKKKKRRTRTVTKDLVTRIANSVGSLHLLCPGVQFGTVPPWKIIAEGEDKAFAKDSDSMGVWKIGGTETAAHFFQKWPQTEDEELILKVARALAKEGLLERSRRPTDEAKRKRAAKIFFDITEITCPLPKKAADNPYRYYGGYAPRRRRRR